MPATFLVATQLAPGGWFSELPVHDATTPWWFRLVADTRPMLDDDVTPGAVRFLLELWTATGDARYRAAAERGIALMPACSASLGRVAARCATLVAPPVCTRTTRISRR